MSPQPRAAVALHPLPANPAPRPGALADAQRPGQPQRAADTAAAITLRDVTVAYRGHPAVHHVSGRFAPGSLTAIVGPNGAGKSSLLAAIMGQLPLAQGDVDLPPGLQGRIAWLPQHHEVDRSFPISVQDLVALGLWRQLGSLRGLGASHRQAVQQALAAVGLAGFERRVISELSAGQFQRALFARVLLQDAPVILLDEPFNAIDARTTADLLALVHRWHEQSRTVIAVLHDMDQVRQHFDQTLLLARRCVAWGPTAQVLDAQHLLMARQMAEAWDESAPSCTVAGSGAGGDDGHAHAHAHGPDGVAHAHGTEGVAHAHAQQHPHLHEHPPHRAQTSSGTPPPASPQGRTPA
jgi:zinc/manganese transport system ATP-binding protein